MALISGLALLNRGQAIPHPLLQRLKPLGAALCQHSRLSSQSLFTHLLDFPELEALTPARDVGMFQTTLFVINKFLYMCESPCSSLRNEPPEADLVLLPLAAFPPSLQSTTQTGFQQHVGAEGQIRNQISFGDLCLPVTKGVF